MNRIKKFVLLIVSIFVIATSLTAGNKIEPNSEISGKLTARCNDCFCPDHKGPRYTYFLKDLKTHKLTELNTEKPENIKRNLGKKVRIKGNKRPVMQNYAGGGRNDNPDVFEVSEIIIETEPEAASAADQGEQIIAGAAPVTTELKCFLVYVDTTDFTFSSSDKSAIENAIFNNSQNVDLCLRSVSRGHIGLTLGKDAGDPGKLTVSLNASVSDPNLENAARSAAFAQINSNDYDHILFFMPNGYGMWAPAWAYVPGNESYYSYGRRTKVETIAHELGHNHGFSHANKWNHSNSTSQEYGDDTCIMGPSPRANESAAFNPAKQDYKGWFDFHSGSLQEPTTDVTLDIYPNALSLDTNPGLRAAKFLGEDTGYGTFYDYYIAYLKEQNPYGLIHDADDKDKVIIYRGEYGGCVSNQWQNLDEGDSYTVNGVSVTFETFGDSSKSYTTVSFDFDDGNTKPVANAQSVSTLINNSLPVTITGSDGDGDSITISLASGPQNGNITGTVPNLTYTPDNNFIGTDSFKFKVDDGKISSYATVTVDVYAPQVSVSASDPNASEEGTDAGVWTFTRTGELSLPLSLDFALSGSATITDDYNINATSPLTLPAGQSSITITLTPVDDSVPNEHSETAVLTLNAGTSYTVGTASDTITITDNDNTVPVIALDSPSLSVAAVPSGGSISIQTTVTDDGEPQPGNLTLTWSKVSGPGTANFTAPNSDDTSVSFTTDGIYELRLTADDGMLQATLDITVAVGSQMPLYEGFESPVVSGYSQGTLPDTGNWVAASQGYKGNEHGIVNEDGGDFSNPNPANNQAYAFRYSNSGLTSAEGTIGTLQADYSYKLVFNVVMDGTATGVPYICELIAFAPGVARNDCRSTPAGSTVVASDSGNAATDGSFTTITIDFTADAVVNASDLGKDLGIRFKGSIDSAIIDDVIILVRPPPSPHSADANSDWSISQSEVDSFISDYNNNNNTVTTANGDITAGRITMREVIRVISLYNNGGAYIGGQGTVDGYDKAPAAAASLAEKASASMGAGEPDTSLVVSSIADSGVGSLRNAIMIAADGETITIDDSLHTITILSEIVIDKSITIDGQGASIVSGDGMIRIFRVENADREIDVTLKNIGIVDAENNSDEFGGAIYNNAQTLTLDTVLLDGNRNTHDEGKGGAVYSSGSLNVDNCVFQNNTASEEDDVYSE